MKGGGGLMPPRLLKSITVAVLRIIEKKKRVMNIHNKQEGFLGFKLQTLLFG
jgi:hypothetical protein